ncbi:MAG: crossover junction endodeoxyribonuclease RuvC [Candidatus Koribacter versatilis]|uniref:Crossover junction endodeoxyribonuclease RuvC n=1 Tax=Candidatus Korobacter versatilis TaxID=658062 RepID=A0A932A8S0_9BACT|nr:crossover junction endodeoxyribonuclease RuvC [Candidatus Koribacter versatilis]
MRVMGIDCGSEVTGYGVVEDAPGGDLRALTSGAITLTGRDRLPARLAHVFHGLCQIIEAYRPDAVAVEDVFYAVNAKSALKLGHVRGVAMLAAASFELHVAEYAPLTIKSAVVGYGKAEKAQVQEMVMRLLKLETRPEPADVADALAIAICHLHTSATLLRQQASAR